jgi:hypothetical protein
MLSVRYRRHVSSVNRRKREAGHSLLFNAVINNASTFPSTNPCIHITCTVLDFGKESLCWGRDQIQVLVNRIQWQVLWTL